MRHKFYQKLTKRFDDLECPNFRLQLSYKNLEVLIQTSDNQKCTLQLPRSVDGDQLFNLTVSLFGLLIKRDLKVTKDTLNILMTWSFRI